MSGLTNQVIMSGLVTAVVIFQPELRRGLQNLGRRGIFRPNKTAPHDKKFILELDKAIEYLSKKSIGALITIERSIGLDMYIETGIDLCAEITGELLINIFIPNTPLHDGAVIIRDEKIAVANAYLPLSENNMIPKEFGTRHRAAVGISEVSDAVTVIVSEETGNVSLAFNNQLFPDLSREEYLAILRKELNIVIKSKD